MNHLLLRLGRTRLLLTEPQLSSLGKPAGYGRLVHHIHETFEVAKASRATVYLVRPRRPMNRALFDVTCDQVPSISQSGWPAVLLRGVWRFSAPMRFGAPGLWGQWQVASLFVPLAYRVLSAARWLPGPWYARVKRGVARLAGWGSAVAGGYASRSRDAWRVLIKDAGRRNRKAARRHRDRPLLFRLPPTREEEAVAVARRLGIAPGDHIVTLHVREAGYQDSLGLRQRASDSARNARIESYFDAVDWLHRQGYIVVRIGDASMTPADRPGLVDLATSRARTDWLELWCVAHSRFFIASDSGPVFLARLFRIPILAVNIIQFLGYFTPRPMDRFVCKLAVDRRTGRQLPLREMLTEEYVTTGRDSSKYRHLDNTREDIEAAVREMLGVVGGHVSRSRLQQQYDARVAELVARWSPAWRRQWSLMVGQRSGTVAHSFVERYFEPLTTVGEESAEGVRM